MKKFFLYFLILPLSFCTTDKDSGLKLTQNPNPSLQKYIEALAPYTSVVSDLEDSIVLGFSKGTTSNDTSWSLLITKKNGVNYCRYNQLLPYKVTGYQDYLDESTKLLYYEGFSFEMNSIKLDSLIALSKLDKFKPTDTIPYIGCAHCPKYMAYFNERFIVSGEKDYDYLRQVDSVVKIELINGLFEKKKNPPIQFQTSK